MKTKSENSVENRNNALKGDAKTEKDAKQAAFEMKIEHNDAELQREDIVDQAQLPELMGWQSTDINGDRLADRVKPENMSDK